MRPRAPIERLTESGCWIYMGVLNSSGYARHRRAYIEAKGPIPPGMTVDHKCRVRCCVNPDHLQLLSLRANILASDSMAARNARRKTCKRGHPREADGRRCRKCAAWHAQQRRDAHPEERQAAAEYARRYRRGEVG